ncbi:hypothetical protein N9937_01655, partial [bacterium]|nr:hypothetical protein [bacterium]
SNQRREVPQVRKGEEEMNDGKDWQAKCKAANKLSVAGEKIQRVRDEVITPLLGGEYLGTQHDVGKMLIRIVGLQTQGEF